MKDLAYRIAALIVVKDRAYKEVCIVATEGRKRAVEGNFDGSAVRGDADRNNLRLDKRAICPYGKPQLHRLFCLLICYCNVSMAGTIILPIFWTAA